MDDAGGRPADADDGSDPTPSEVPRSESTPKLGSRILVTWLELTVVGLAGGALGTTVGGPPGFVIYLTTTLFTVGVLLYNVNELIEARIEAEATDESA